MFLLPKHNPAKGERTRIQVPDAPHVFNIHLLFQGFIHELISLGRQSHAGIIPTISSSEFDLPAKTTWVDVKSPIHKMGAGWTNYADRLQGVWGAAILSARTANRLFSSKLCSFHLATTYGHCLSPNSSYLLLWNWNQNTWVINPRQSCFLQQHWKYPRSWSREHTEINPWQSYPKQQEFEF